MIKHVKSLLILSLFLLSISVSLSSEKVFLGKSEVLPIFGLEIPQTITQPLVSTFNVNDDEIKVIVRLKEPSAVWASEVSSMTEKDINNLKTVMRDYSINKVGRENVKHQYSSFNGFSATLTYQEYQSLLNNPLVESVQEDMIVKAFMQDTVGIIGANTTWNTQINGQNLTGQGQTVCVIDTGVNYSHPDLGGCSLTSISEQIESYVLTPAPANPYPDNYDYNWTITKTGYERIAVYFEYIDIENDYDFIHVYDENDNLYATYTGTYFGWSEIVPGDTIKVQFVSDVSINGSDGFLGFNITATKNVSNTYEDEVWQNCNKIIGGYDFYNQDNNPMDDHFHGTHIAGTLAANGIIKGVAPDSKIVAVKSLNLNGSGMTSDIIAGIYYCINNADKYNISVISMSLGGTTLYNDYCDSDYPNTAYSDAISLAVSKNISVVVATGNNGNSNNIASPACIYNATRVGSTNKSDNTLSYFSNRWALDMVVAPGANINSTYYLGNYVYSSGTSMATPHVAGAIAIINQYFKENNTIKTPFQIKSLLKETGKIIVNDSRNYSRIDLPSFFNNYSSVVYFNSIKIASDSNSEYANTNNLVTLNFTSSVPVNAPEVMIGNYSAQVINLGGNTSWSASRMLNTSDPQGLVTFKINNNTYSTSDSSYVIFDYLAPEVIDAVYPHSSMPGQNYTIRLNFSYGYAPVYQCSIPNYERFIDSEWEFKGEGKIDVIFTYTSFINDSGLILNFTFNATDLNHNSTLYNLSIFINDTLAPRINILSPINGSTYANLTQLVNISAQDNNLEIITYNYNGGENITYNESVLKIFSPGLNNLNVYANDSFGNINSSTIFFTIDTIAPNLTIISPINTTYNNATQLVNLNFSNDTVNAWFNWNGVNITYNSSTLITFNEGFNTLHAWANDSLGNTNYSIVSFTIDTIAPNLTIISPINTTYSNATQLVNLSMGFDVVNAWINFNNTNITYVSPMFFNFTEGINTLTAYANDSASNLNMTKRVFTIDTIKPIINILSLNNGSYYNNATRLLNISVIDITSTNIWYNFNGTNMTYNSSELVIFNEGLNTLRVWANDSAGNINSTIISFTIDSVPPLVEIINPLNNGVVNSTIMIQANISDANLANVSLLVDNQLFMNKSANYSEFYYPTNLLNDGNHSFKIIAYDLAGNFNSSTINLTVSNTNPVLLNVAGNFTLGTGIINSSVLNGTGLESVIDEITGLSSENVTIRIGNGSSTYLSNTLGVLSINASTLASSTVRFLIPQVALQKIGLSVPYSTLIVYAIHSNGQESKIDVNYESNVSIGDLVFERFNFTTTHFSTFFYGPEATCTDGIQNQGETGVDCGGPCPDCPVYNPGGGGSTGGFFSGGFIEEPVNESGINNSKTYEYVTYDGLITKSLMNNKVLVIDLGSNSYSFEISSMNDNSIYLNISNYGLVKLFEGVAKEIILDEVIYSLMLEKLESGVATISFQSLAQAGLESMIVTGDIVYLSMDDKIIDESQDRLINFIIVLTYLGTAIIMIIKILSIFK